MTTLLLDTGLTTEEATEFFKLLNNANDYLSERA